MRREVAIIGGGPAGLSAALVLGRARIPTVLVDAGQPRNRVTQASHGFFTRDGTPGLELQAIGRAQLEPYPALSVLHDRVRSVGREGAGFALRTASNGVLEADRLILATGFEDDVDGLCIPELAAVWGRSVFPCPFCDGYEQRDKALAVFGADHAEHLAMMLRVWSEDVAVFTHGGAVDVHALAARGVTVYAEAIARLHHDGGRLRAVELDDGRCVPREAGFLAGVYSAPAPFAAELGLAKAEHPWGLSVPEVGEHGVTAIPNLLVVGDAAQGFVGVAAAAYQGSICAQRLVGQIAQERWG